MSADTLAIDSSSCHTAFEESLAVSSADDRAESSSTSGGSEYFSARIETMMQTRSQFSDHVEHEIEFSKAPWNELISKHPTVLHQEEEDGEDKEKEDRSRELETL